MKAVIIYYPDEAAKQNDETEGGIYIDISYNALISEYGIEEENILLYIPFIVSGKTYAERKADLHNKAVEWSNTQGSYSAWSYGELAEVSEFFEKNGKRYGLLAEFRENAII